MKRIFQDKRNLLILLLTVLFAIRIPREDIRFALWVCGGVFIAVCWDMLINRAFFKKDIIPKSAIITGIITAGIIDYNQPWLLLTVFSSVAIISKHIIRYKKTHIFNPANFALFMAALFRVPLTWNIESNIYLIIISGLYIAYSIKKLPHIAGFLVVFTGLFLTQGINPFMLISWFFVFIMLIEPKTSGFGVLRGSVFGAIAGAVSFLVFKFFPGYDLFVMSLFAANLSNLFWIYKKLNRPFSAVIDYAEAAPKLT